MLERFIPDYHGEIQRLTQICSKGFIMGYGISTRERPDYLVNTMPVEWSTIYENANYMFYDPVVHWLLDHDGSIRWSEIRGPDIRSVRAHAASFGIKFGCVISYKVKNRRCFLSMAREDREFADDEIAAWKAKFHLWSQRVVDERPVLNERELSVLRALGDGMTHKEAADFLNISMATVRQRQASAMHKLGAKNPTSAVRMATAYQLLDVPPSPATNR